MHPFLRRISAVVSMAFGLAGVFGLLYYMNELTKPPRQDKAKVAKAFQVEKKPKKKKRPKPKQTKQRKRVSTAAKPAPLPNITTSMSGLSFDLPQFENDDMMSTDRLLAGKGNHEKLVMTEDTVDSLPRARTQKAPEYPAKARQRGIQGYVLLKLRVSERGDVESAKVLEAEPSGVFEQVAVTAVRQWTFEPARYKGTPVAIAVSQRIPFRLTNSRTL